MKRLSVALAAIGLTAAAGAYAALPAATDPTLVNVPQLPGGFVVGLSGYYMEASSDNGDLDYASTNINTAFNAFYSKLQSVDTGYDWGWGANIGYVFPDTGNDVNLSYFYLDTSDDNTHVLINSFDNVNGNINTITPINNIINFNTISFTPLSTLAIDGLLNSAVAESSYRINQVDLTAGQFINVGCRLRLHPIAGLRYADVDRSLNSAYEGFNTGSTTVAIEIATSVSAQNQSFARVYEDSDFSGIGPLAGIDATYYIGMGFGAVAHADAAMLIGSTDAKTDVYAGNTITQQAQTADGAVIQAVPITNAGVFTYRDDSNRRVVPVGDLKLGLDYTYLFNNAANSDLTLEIGWQASEYYNAIDRLETESTVPTNSLGPITGGASRVFASRTSSVGIDGPYATLTLHV